MKTWKKNERKKRRDEKVWISENEWRLMFVVCTREEKRREEKREEKEKEKKRRKARQQLRTSWCESLRNFRMLQTQKNRGYTKPNITSHTWKTTQTSNSWLARQPINKPGREADHPFTLQCRGKDACSKNTQCSTCSWTIFSHTSTTPYVCTACPLIQHKHNSAFCAQRSHTLP